MYTVKYQFFIQFFTTVLSCILAECQSSGEDISQNFLLFACTQTFFFRCFSNSCSPENLLGEIITGRKETLPAITQSSQMGMGMLLLRNFPLVCRGPTRIVLVDMACSHTPNSQKLAKKGGIREKRRRGQRGTERKEVFRGNLIIFP